MNGKAFVLAVLATAALAGCLQTDDSGSDQPPADTPDPTVFAAGEWPSGQSARDYIESYIMTHPFRVGGQPYQSYMDAARTDLVAILEGFGNNLTILPDAYDDYGLNILAIQNGTTHPEQWVVLSAHYDSISPGTDGITEFTTIYGAWDDGAGTAALIELARTLSSWKFPFTIVYAFFDGEEKGLRGSAAFVEKYYEADGVQLVANLNTDPPGLNWPCGDHAGLFPVKVIQEDDKVAARPDYAWLSSALETALTTVGVPAEALDKTGGIPVATVGGSGLTGGSDHMSFGDQDIPNVFIGGVPLTIVGGNPDDHVVAAMTYPLHTPLDTLQAMEARCTQGTLAGGLQTTVDLFSHTLTEMARTH